MSLLLDIFRWIFTVVGWLLLLILFLMFFPVRADILLEDAVLYIDLKYLFFRIKVLPSKKKKKEAEYVSDNESAAESLPEEEQYIDNKDQKEQDKEKREKTAAAYEREEKSVGDTITRIVSLIRKIMQPAYWLVRMLLKTVHIEDVSVIVCVTGEDPASVGFRSGLQWSFIGSFMTLLNQLFGKNVTYNDVTVLPCFNGVSEKKEKLSFSISAQPIIILMITLGAALGYVFELIKDLFSRGGKKNVN